jgi:hypothetical protein
MLRSQLCVSQEAEPAARGRAAEAACALQQKERRLPAAKRRLLEARQDVEDFAAEYRLLKKVKKGRLSEVSICFQHSCLSKPHNMQEC